MAGCRVAIDMDKNHGHVIVFYTLNEQITRDYSGTYLGIGNDRRFGNATPCGMEIETGEIGQDIVVRDGVGGDERGNSFSACFVSLPLTMELRTRHVDSQTNE